MRELQKKYNLYKKKNHDNPGIGRLYESIRILCYDDADCSKKNFPTQLHP